MISRHRVGQLRADYAMARLHEDPDEVGAALAAIYAEALPLVARHHRLDLRSSDVDGIGRPSKILDALDGGAWVRTSSGTGSGDVGGDDQRGGEIVQQLYAGPDGVLAERTLYVAASGAAAREMGEDDEDTRFGVEEMWTDDILDDGTDITYEPYGVFDYETLDEAWQHAKGAVHEDESWKLNGPSDEDGILDADVYVLALNGTIMPRGVAVTRNDAKLRNTAESIARNIGVERDAITILPLSPADCPIPVAKAA